VIIVVFSSSISPCKCHFHAYFRFQGYGAISHRAASTRSFRTSQQRNSPLVPGNADTQDQQRRLGAAFALHLHSTARLGVLDEGVAGLGGGAAFQRSAQTTYSERVGRCNLH